jgi:predicted transcriptional regulator
MADNEKDNDMSNKNLATSYFQDLSDRKYRALKKVPSQVSFRSSEDRKTVEYHVSRMKDTGVTSNELEARFMLFDVLRGMEPSTKAEIAKRLGDMDEYLNSPRKKFSRTK